VFRQTFGLRILMLAAVTGATLALHAESRFASTGAFRREIDRLASAGRFSGVVLAAPRDGEAWSVVSGNADEAGAPITVDTVFNLASVSKLFTAVAVGQLVDQGRVRWDDPVSRHLPEFAAPWATQVKVEHLLTHTSGLGDFLDDPDYRAARGGWRAAADYLPLLARQSLAGEPGAQFRYSNAGFILLGAIIESVTGERYDAAVRRLILDPVGMMQTRFLYEEPERGAVALAQGYTRRPAGGGPVLLRPGDEPPPKRPVPFGEPSSAAGGVFSTAHDMLAFAEALGDGRLLKPDTFRLMTTARVDAPAGRAPPGVVLRHGLGFGVREVHGMRLVGYNGGAPGVAAQFDLLPDGTVVVVLLNDDLALMPILRVLHETL